MEFRQRTAILILIFAGLLIFIQSLRNPFILGDDFDQIVNHVQVHSISSIPQFFFESTYYNHEDNQSYGLFYRPLMLSTYSLLYAFAGPNPTIFHFAHLVIHIANAILLFFFLCTFFPEVFAFLLASIFLVHPINSETVIHSANLQDVLFFFFGILMLVFLTLHHTQHYTWKTKTIIGVLFILSLFSKETGIVFGICAVLYLWLFDKKNIKNIIPPIGIATITYAIFRFLLSHVGFGNGSISQISHASLPIRILNMPAIITKYLITFFLPLTLQTAQLWIIQKFTLSGFFIPLIIVIAFISIAICIGFAIHRHHKKFFPVYIFFSVWFTLGICLHLQIIPLDVTVAERWFYFPIVGMLGMMGVTYSAFFGKEKKLHTPVLIIVLFIIVSFSIRTYIRTLDWQSAEILFQHELSIDPHNYLIENNLGTLDIQNGEYTKAAPYIKDSVRQYQYFGNVNNMAIIATHEKNIPLADKYFTRALSIQTSYMVYQNYAYFLTFIANDCPRTIAITTTGLHLYPNGASLFVARAVCEYQMGNVDDAKQDAQHAMQLAPSDWTNEVYNAILQKRDINVEKFFKLD